MSGELLKLPTDPDAQWCLKCGKDALDTGWECTECGYDCAPFYCPEKYGRAATGDSGNG